MLEYTETFAHHAVSIYLRITAETLPLQPCSFAGSSLAHAPSPSIFPKLFACTLLQLFAFRSLLRRTYALPFSDSLFHPLSFRDKRVRYRDTQRCHTEPPFASQWRNTLRTQPSCDQLRAAQTFCRRAEADLVMAGACRGEKTDRSRRFQYMELETPKESDRYDGAFRTSQSPSKK